MSNTDHTKIKELAQELGKSIKTQEELPSLTSLFMKMAIEASQGAEIEEHLGCSKNQPSDSYNSRNGYANKTVKGDHGELKLNVPRYRKGTFEPIMVKKAKLD